MSRDEIVAAARQWVGTPYRHQASTLGAGCDCLGLVRGVWRGVVGPEPEPIPPYRADARDAASVAGLLALGVRVLAPAGPKILAGQVLVFRLRPGRAPRHCGIVVAPGRFVHAQERLGVVEASLTEPWRRRLAGRFEFPALVQ